MDRRTLRVLITKALSYILSCTVSTGLSQVGWCDYMSFSTNEREQRLKDVCNPKY